MAEFTLLAMTQNILSALGSDEVNSISDTTESMQVAQIIQNKYYDLISRGDLPEHEIFYQLEPSESVETPTLMYIPDGIASLRWIKYFDTNVNDGGSDNTTQFGSYSHGVNTDIVTGANWMATATNSVTIGQGNKTFTIPTTTPVTIGQWVSAASGTNIMFGMAQTFNTGTGALVINVTSIIGSGTYNSWVLTGNNGPGSPPGYTYVELLPVDEFINMINRLTPSETNVGSYFFSQGGENFQFYYYNNKQPQWATVISNNYVIFDSYDNTQDSTLQQSKTLCFGKTVPSFTLSDTFIPNIMDEQFPLLINEAKSWAFYELKQQPHQKADREAQRQWSSVGRNKHTINQPTYFNALADFGRVPRTGGFAFGGYGAYKWMRQV